MDPGKNNIVVASDVSALGSASTENFGSNEEFDPFADGTFEAIAAAELPTTAPLQTIVKKKRKKRKKKKTKKKKIGEQEQKQGEYKHEEGSSRSSLDERTSERDGPNHQATIRDDYTAFLPPPPEEASMVTNTAGGLAHDSLVAGNVLPFDKKSYLHGLHSRLQQICPRLKPPTARGTGLGPRVNDNRGVETATGIVDDWDVWFNQADLPDDDPEAIEKQLKEGMLDTLSSSCGFSDGVKLPAAAARSDYHPVSTPFGPGHLVGPLAASGGKMVEVELAFGTAYLQLSLLGDEEVGTAFSVQGAAETECVRQGEAETVTSDIIENLGRSLTKLQEAKMKDSAEDEMKIKESKDAVKEEEEEEHSSDDENQHEFEENEDPFLFEEQKSESKDRNETYAALERHDGHKIVVENMPESIWTVVDGSDDEGEDCD